MLDLEKDLPMEILHRLLKLLSLRYANDVLKCAGMHICKHQSRGYLCFCVAFFLVSACLVLCLGFF